jgi:hypothetical protein
VDGTGRDVYIKYPLHRAASSTSLNDGGLTSTNATKTARNTFLSTLRSYEKLMPVRLFEKKDYFWNSQSTQRTSERTRSSYLRSRQDFMTSRLSQPKKVTIPLPKLMRSMTNEQAKSTSLKYF